MGFLLHFDRWLFLLINQSWANPVFDVLMPFITEEDNFVFVLAALWLLLFWRAKRKGRIVAVATLAVIAMSDQTAAHLFKPFFSRQRPPYALETVRLLVDTTRSFSFPSVHAANAFAVSAFVSSFYPVIRPYLYVVAALVAYSRVYVGVHFPSDVVAGALLGLGLGLGAAFLTRRFLGQHLSGKVSKPQVA